MSGEKVLIVDDDDDILLIVQEILTSAGYTTLLARNGREAVDMALQLKPD
jgi:CheY-like chemotaxis protein